MGDCSGDELVRRAIMTLQSQRKPVLITVKDFIRRIMNTAPKSSQSGALFALGAFGLFATHDVLIKFLGGVYSPFQIIFFSTLMSFPLVTLVLMRDPSEENLLPHHPYWTALRTACAVIATLSAFYAFSVLPLAQTYAILFAMPLAITLLSIPILGENVGWRRGVAVCVGLIGVLVVLRPGTTPLNFGHLAALSAALFSAMASVVVRKIGREERSVVLLLYPVVASFLIMAALMPMTYKPMPIQHLGAIGLVSLLGFSAGLMLIAAYKRAEAATVAPMQYSQIIWATVYGYLFLRRGDRLADNGGGSHHHFVRPLHRLP